jgi:uncharacterized membrane protein YphA (DoxX/SURF4 family)
LTTQAALLVLVPVSSLAAEVNLATRLMLGAVFILAGAAKVWRFSVFSVTLSSLGIPTTLAMLLTPAVIFIEVSLGMAFLLDLLPFLTAGCAVLLLTTFATLGVRAERTHLTVPCSCFGVSEEPLGYMTALRALLLGLTVVVLVFTQTPGVLSVRGWDEGFSAALAAALALLLGRWLLAVPHLHALIGDRRRWEAVATPTSLAAIPQPLSRN